MIVRILGEGQFEVPDSELTGLNELDNVLGAAVEADDEPRFRAALAGLLGRVRQVGSPLPAEALEPSELVLPGSESDLHEVRELLGEEGLIPG